MMVPGEGAVSSERGSPVVGLTLSEFPAGRAAQLESGLGVATRLPCTRVRTPRNPLGPSRRPMPRILGGALGDPMGGGVFLGARYLCMRPNGGCSVGRGAKTNRKEGLET